MTNTLENWEQELKAHEAWEKQQYRELREANYKHQREILKGAAKDIRAYLKQTGGTYSVRVQPNNVLWISGAYTFGVPYEDRQFATNNFYSFLEGYIKTANLDYHNSGFNILIKYKEEDGE